MSARIAPTRLFLYRGDMDAEWAAYGPDAKAWSRGLRRRAQRLCRAGALRRGAAAGRVRADGERAGAVERRRPGAHPQPRHQQQRRVRGRCGRGSWRPAASTPTACAASWSPSTSCASRRGPRPGRHPRRHAGRLCAGDQGGQLRARRRAAARAARADDREAPRRAPTTGRSRRRAPRPAAPILASDPHRVLVAPSIRYVVHLDAPGLSVMGAGELHLPGVTIGHNGRIAFGITIFMVDQADLYVYELNPENPRQYRYGDGWEDMRIVRETVAVKGEAAREVELAFTRHGPVLKIDPAARRAFALRSVWFEPGTSPYFGAARYQTAGDWADVQGGAGALGRGGDELRLRRRRRQHRLDPRRLHAPAAELGRPDARARRRPLRVGRVPRPRTSCPASTIRPRLGRHRQRDEPAADGYPAEALQLGFEWADPGRGCDRIAEVLAANDRDDASTTPMALQIDVVSLTALRGGRPAARPDVGRSRRSRQAPAAARTPGTAHETVDSAAAAIAEVWLNKHLAPAHARQDHHAGRRRADRASARPMRWSPTCRRRTARSATTRRRARGDPARQPALGAGRARRAARARTWRPGAGATCTTPTSCRPRRRCADPALRGADDPRPDADPRLGLHRPRRHLPDGGLRHRPTAPRSAWCWTSATGTTAG